MSEFHMRRSSRAIAGLLLAGSMAITACATPPLSPDETKLAYLSWDGDRPLVVRDLATRLQVSTGHEFSAGFPAVAR